MCESPKNVVPSCVLQKEQQVLTSFCNLWEIKDVSLTMLVNINLEANHQTLFHGMFLTIPSQ